MKLLSNSKEISKALSLLIKKYQKYYILTAWASGEHNVFNDLIKNKNNIIKMIVGIKFYQTNPNFIREFLDSSTVKFMIKSQEGVFHPKVYLFENSGNDWQCLIGSANFTKSAMSINNEIMLQINKDDNNAKDVYIQLKKQIDEYWKNAESIDNEYFRKYIKLFEKNRIILDKMENKYTQYKSKKTVIESEVLMMNWSEYYQRVKDDKLHSYDGRIKLLETAREYFEHYKSFQNMPDNIRKQIAGIKIFNPDKDTFDWAWFGSMKGAGSFKQKINENNIHISNALDCIPLNGVVTYSDYMNFIENFKKAFNSSCERCIAIVTRLLSMKRPDYFICFDNQNKDKLCNDFDIKKSLDYDGYWNEIIQRIQDSLWWNSEKPKDENELKAWNGRVAMLDVIFYEKKGVRL